MKENDLHRKASVRSLKLLATVCLAWVGFRGAQPTMMMAVPVDPQNDSGSTLSRGFRCPEQYSSAADKKSALDSFVSQYSLKFPNNNLRDMMLFRYHLLVEHSCTETLKSMLTDVSPISEMLRVNGKDFGPRTEEFDPRTKVWTVYFRKDGEPANLSEEEVIFNFYGWNTGISAESVAKAFIAPRPNIRVIGDFQAPDGITKQPAYFIVSETTYPKEGFGYLNVSKVTSVGAGAYTVSLTKKIVGRSIDDIVTNGKAWYLSEEGQAVARVIGNVGVDETWEQYFKHARE